MLCLAVALQRDARGNWDAAFGLEGVEGDVYAVASIGTNLYIGGAFSKVGGVAAANVARWDGVRWWPMDGGMNGAVWALAVVSNTLWAGGDFTIAGGKMVNYIAYWSGTNWMALPSGPSRSVYALVASGTNLYAGGEFMQAGGKSVRRVARWDGTTWRGLVSGNVTGVSDAVYALGIYNNVLYVGGYFSSAGGVTAYGVAGYNGTNWFQIGSGLEDWALVDGMAVTSNGVVVGGLFEMAGNSTVNNIAQWNGKKWLALSSGLNNYCGVVSAAPSGTIYAGGDFLTAGGVRVNHIARWNGAVWSALGSGLDDAPEAIWVDGDNVWVGGYFLEAGGVPSRKLARWNPNLPRVRVTAPVPTAPEGGAAGQFTFTRAVMGTNTALTVRYHVGGTASNGVDYATLSGSVTIPAGQTNVTIAVAATNDSVAELTETVTVTILPAYAYLGEAPVTATVSIVDGSAAEVTITATDPQAAEWPLDSGQFTVSRTGNTTGALTVFYTLSGSASNGLDYAALPGSLTLTAGTSSAIITVTPLADTLAEGTETVTLSVLSNAAYAIGNAGSATVNIADRPMDAWRYAMFGAQANNPLIACATCDPDGDGIANLIEYGLGLDPRQSSTLPRPVIENNRLTLIYTRRMPPTDVSYQVEATGQLTSGWSTNGITEQVLGSDGMMQTNKAIDGATVSANPSRFLRVKVTQP